MITTTQQTARKERGKTIAIIGGQVKFFEETIFEVKSQSGNGKYEVLKTSIGWMCSCPDHIYRHIKCKHIYAVNFSLALKKRVESKRITPINNVSSCIYCKSTNIVKDGVRHNKHTDIQKFYCRNCQQYFSFNVGFEKMKHSPQAITTALQLYFSGESLRNTQKSLRLLGVEVVHSTVYKWIKKYIGLMEKYIEKLKPEVSDTWRADELWVKFKGDMKYVFAIMDDETRCWIAQEVAETKFKHDARKLFQLAKKVTGKKPMTLITDGLPAYNDAYKKEFWTLRNPRTNHIRHIKIRGDKNNNKMERLNGEIRDREKVMRGLKKKDTPILKGYQIFHNYIRTHEGLNGKTPAEACGINVEGKNKWKTLIQNASRNGN
ncbi:MAG: DDE-type integrase/transposase/recombinase [Candidatus Bathyarchaeota archaeon]|nr:DDE-type integrase/transposase/recombinase [Candidatus Bathyarchaeota archaeon]